MQYLLDDANGLVKRSYSIRRVPGDDLVRVLPLPEFPQVGDVLLTKLEKIGKNARIELTNGRVAMLHEGDMIACVLGNRYATEQFEGYAEVRGDACDLLSMGGLCGTMSSRHAGVAEPSKLRILGALGDRNGKPLRLSDYAVTPRPFAQRPKVIAVCGSSMDSGKTHTARSVILGLRKLGLQVAGIKLTGTAAGRDTWSMQDVGARPALDFLDGGFPSTYLCSLDQLMTLHGLLLGHAAMAGAAWAVIEIADGVLQRETTSLLRCKAFVSSVDTWLYATGDAPGAAGGVSVLRTLGIEPAAISGLIAMSPLAMREATEATGVRCVTALELQTGDLNDRLLARAPVQVDTPPSRGPSVMAGGSEL